MARPRIACFHGGGSTSKIYEYQCARLQELLRPDFEFVYFEAPFTRSAGPGVLPFFEEESFGPYKTWFKSEDLQDGSGYGSGESARDGVQRVWEMMRDVGEGGEWVAAMGFSQGSRVVGGLLLDQQLRAKAGLVRGDGDVELKFGVLCMGSGAPMISAMSRVDASHGELEQISIPTFHLHGLKDANLLPGRKQLATYYDPQTTKLMEIDYHHAMPWNRDDLYAFAKFLRDAYSATQSRP
ncbi:putative esterase [Lachnellula occidentalis]|uniref:Putative esterase n=1 Tax=Lachnellula occidentalis TaxID=215460 RepID=A0A8H8UJA5_9HELO|nr:putative esterase [Lachnellula occidentalis]